MSSNIRIEIDDTALDALIARFDQAALGASSMGVRGTRASKGISMMDRIYLAGVGYERTTGRSSIPPEVAEELKKSTVLDSLRNLPTLDRNMRVIINQIPGGRLASQTLFRARWIGKMMDDYPTETMMVLGATAIMVAKAVSGFMSDVRRDREQYRNLLTDYQPTITKEYLDKWISEREDWWRRYITG